jgi:hypothetical protein
MRDGTFWDRAKETRSRSEREAGVLAHLKTQLRYAYDRLPFYRPHYDKHGFHPEAVKTLDDFTKRVPVITKPMLRDDQAAHGPFGHYLGVESSEIARVFLIASEPAAYSSFRRHRRSAQMDLRLSRFTSRRQIVIAISAS